MRTIETGPGSFLGGPRNDTGLDPVSDKVSGEVFSVTGPGFETGFYLFCKITKNLFCTTRYGGQEWVEERSSS